MRGHFFGVFHTFRSSHACCKLCLMVQRDMRVQFRVSLEGLPFVSGVGGLASVNIFSYFSG